MQKIRRFVLVLASVFLASTFSARAQFADTVVAYEPGAGVSVDFSDPASALGEPSRVTPGAFGGPVTPFNPPYLGTQLVSIGAGGSLTLQFAKPIHDHPRNRFGVDFIVFGNCGFIITNEFSLETFDWVGTPATDGSLFGANDGSTRVSVSADGVNFYVLDPVLAPTVDGSLPTDGTGDFTIPADPTLTTADFTGLTEEQIRALYHGSAGGVGFDIATAQDSRGNPVHLQFVTQVWIEVLGGKSEVDGVAAVFNPPGRPR